MAAGIPPGTAKSGTGDITGVTAGDGLSGGGTDGGVTVTLDLNELTAAAVADGDFIPIIDTNDSNGSRKEAVADLATLFAGDGLSASSSVLAVGVDDSTIETSSDALRIKDNGVTLAKMAGLTRGSMIIGNASGDPAELTKGSANYVLTSDGTDIAWAAASGGAVTALNNATANEIVTVGSTTTELDAESTLTFASNKLIPTATAHNAAGTALTMSAGATTAGTTNNIAGGALTFQGGQGKGSGAGGDIIFQTANAAGSGSSLNSLATALTLSDDLSATFAGAVTALNALPTLALIFLTASAPDSAPPLLLESTPSLKESNSSCLCVILFEKSNANALPISSSIALVSLNGSSFPPKLSCDCTTLFKRVIFLSFAATLFSKGS